MIKTNCWQHCPFLFSFLNIPNCTFLLPYASVLLENVVYSLILDIIIANSLFDSLFSGLLYDLANCTLDLITTVFTWPHHKRPFQTCNIWVFFLISESLITCMENAFLFQASDCFFFICKFEYGFCQHLWYLLVPYALFYLQCGERELPLGLFSSNMVTHSWVSSFVFGTLYASLRVGLIDYLSVLTSDFSTWPSANKMKPWQNLSTSFPQALYYCNSLTATGYVFLSCIIRTMVCNFHSSSFSLILITFPTAFHSLHLQQCPSCLHFCFETVVLALVVCLLPFHYLNIQIPLLSLSNLSKCDQEVLYFVQDFD